MSHIEDDRSTQGALSSVAAVEPVERARHLPVYLLLDTSSDMAGAPIQGLQQGLELLQTEISSDPFARDVVWIGIITFGATVQFVTDRLVPVVDLKIPNLIAAGPRRLDLAFMCLRESLDRDVRLPGPGQPKGDWRPNVFVLISGSPQDKKGNADTRWKVGREWAINPGSGRVAPCEIIAMGMSQQVDQPLLTAIGTGKGFRMGTDQASFTGLFQYVDMFEE